MFSSTNYYKTSYHNCSHKHEARLQSAGSQAGSVAWGSPAALPFPPAFSNEGNYLPSFTNNSRVAWQGMAYANNGYYGQTLADAPNPANSYYVENNVGAYPTPANSYFAENSATAYANQSNSYYVENRPQPFPMPPFVPTPKQGGGGHCGNKPQFPTVQPNGMATDYQYLQTPYGYPADEENFPMHPPQRGFLPPPPPTELPKPVAANERGKIWGDPHIIDGDNKNESISFDVFDAGTFSILEDKGIQFNAKFETFPTWGASVTTEAGINLNGAKVAVMGDGSTTVNGRKLQEGETVTLADGAKITQSGRTVKVATNPDSGEYDLEFTAVDSGQKLPDGSAINYINTKVLTRSTGVLYDATAPKGIVGEGFDADAEERKALKLGSADKYKADKLLVENPVNTNFYPPAFNEGYFPPLGLPPFPPPYQA